MRLCLSGYFGTRNTGDELLLDAAYQGMLRKFGNFEVAVLAAFPDAVSALHPDIPIVGTARNTGWQRTGHVVSNESPAANTATLELIDGSDALVICGGGLWGNGTVYGMDEVRHAAALGKPVFCISMGVDPFNPDLAESYQQNYFRHVRACVTRDRWGAICLSRIRTHEVCRVVPAADSVFFLLQPSAPALPKIAHVCICNLRTWKNHVPPHMTMETTAAALGRGIRDACDRFGVIPRLYPFSPDQGGAYDLVRARQFSELSGGFEIVENTGSTPPQIFDGLTAACVVVSERYHACILAALCGVPFISLCMDHKNREIARMFGMPWITLDEHMIGDRIYAALVEVLEHHDEYRMEISGRIDSVRMMSERNFEAVRL